MGKKRKTSKYQLNANQIEWSDTSYPAAIFLQKFTLPQVAKLNSGEYGNFGCGTDVNVSQPFLLHTERDCTKVLAENLAWNKVRQQYRDTGTQIVIPTNYPGWFSYRGEEVSHFKPWTSISEISFHNTSRIVTCTSLTCFMQSGCNANGQRIYVKKICPPGEVFTLGDRYIERTTRRNAVCCYSWMKSGKFNKESVEEVDYVLAKDSSNTDLLIPMEARGVFCKIGRVLSDGRIESQAVYKMNDLIDVVPIPCIVELVHGKSPSKAAHFSGILRLDETYQEETVIACTLGTNQFTLLELPLDSDIEFIPAKNNQSLFETKHVEQAHEFCLEEVLSYIVSLKVIQNFFASSNGGEQRKESRSRSAKVKVKEPVPPPLPLLGPEEEEAEEEITQNEGIFGKTDTNNDKIDVNSVSTKESHYETIPFDKGHVSRTVISMHQSYSAGDQPIETAENDYLVPIRNTSSAIYSNFPQEQARHKNIRRSSSNISSQQRFGAVCPANSIINGAEPFLLNETLINRETTVLTDLPPVGRERMDRFLQDSLEELNRVRLSGEMYDSRNYCDSLKKSRDKPEKPPHEMQAKLDAFLDDIFDCDKLEKPNMKQNRVINGPPENKQSTPNLSAKHVFKENAHIVRSFSDINVPTVFPDNNSAKMNRTLESYAKQDNANDSSSSSRSVSDIYRQMKYPSYHRSDSIGAEYPYPRADSGIVVSPRYSASERDCTRQVYRALSEMSWQPPLDISPLSVEEVALSLLYIGLKQVSIDLFSDQQIDGRQLLDIDEALLTEGFPELNALEKKKVLDFIKGWRPKKLLV